MSKTILLSAGEISGDAYGAKLAQDLSNHDVRILGMGQTQMQKAGVEIIIDSSEIAVMGIGAVLSKYCQIRQALKAMQAAILTHKPDVLVCIDYKEFNFKLAKFAKSHGVKVIFYIAPTIWAWRPKRIKKYKSVADLMAVIFPFEVPLWEAAGIPTIYAGNPLTNKVKVTIEKSAFCDSHKLDENKPIIGLLPGSRASEIKRLMPILLNSAAAILETHPEAQFVFPYERGMKRFNWGQSKHHANDLTQKLRDEGFDFTLTSIANDFYNTMNACDVAICASGTASLEVAMLGTPQVVTYKTSSLSYWILSHLIKTPWVSLTNILLGREVTKEYLQSEATPENLKTEVLHLLANPAPQLKAYNELIHLLSSENAENLAKEVLK